MYVKVTLILSFCTLFCKVHSDYSNSSYQEDESCILPDNIQGKCTLLNQCPTAIEGLLKFLTPQSCGFNGSEPIVCCASNKSAEMCQKYKEEVSELKIYPIIGGTRAHKLEYPHMAALGYGDKNNVQWNCGGSLISEKFVLTAAHCLNSELGIAKYVRLGEDTLQNVSNTVQDFQIASRIPHPDYKPPAVYHDIALVELNKRPTYTYYVKPACLYINPVIEEGVLWSLKAVGWGLTSFGGEPSTILQQVYLEQFTLEECSRVYRKTRRLPRGILQDSQLCAGGKEEEKDTCQGDSGGPLEIYKFEIDLASVVGVTAFGQACGTVGIPGVYTRVSYYVPWIESVVWP